MLMRTHGMSTGSELILFMNCTTNSMARKTASQVYQLLLSIVSLCRIAKSDCFFVA